MRKDTTILRKARNAAKVLGVIALATLYFSRAQADDPRCHAPPYGLTDAEFKAFVQNFGHVITPTKMLPALCDSKFGGGDRTGLYNLGFTDRDIDTKKLGDLAIEMVIAFQNFAKKLP